MSAPPPTPVDLRLLLAHLLAGATDSDEADWLPLIGEVQRLALTKSPRTNWLIVPKGTKAERAAIGRAVEIVRGEHPYVAW